MAIHHAGHSDGITVRGSFWMRFATVTPMLSVFRFVFQKKMITKYKAVDHSLGDNHKSPLNVHLIWHLIAVSHFIHALILARNLLLTSF